MISGAASDPSCPQASDLPDKSMISYQKGEKDIMKKQTRIAAVLSAAAFMTMVSGLPAYAASHGWVPHHRCMEKARGRLVLSW